jgi:hypothetical protein
MLWKYDLRGGRGEQERFRKKMINTVTISGKTVTNNIGKENQYAMANSDWR